MGRPRRIQNPVFKAIVGTLFFGAFAAGGTFAMIKAAVELPAARASREWPAADGTITRSAIVLKSKGRKRHRIRYEYEVGGQLYESKRIAFMDRVFGGNASDRYRRYPNGSTVDVYYDPDDPSLAVIEPGVRLIGFVGAILIGAVFTPIGIWGLRASYRS